MIEEISLDTFAMANPALCSVVLWAFINGYCKNDKTGCDFLLIFLPIPLTLSGMFDSSFQGTNANTGFFEWLNRNPGISIDYSRSIRDCRDLTLNGLRFALYHELLSINDDARLISCRHSLLKKNTISANSEIHSFINKAERFGKWVGKVASTQIIYQSLGIKP